MMVHAQPVTDTAHFVKIPSGIYQLGEKGHAINPLHTAQLSSFYISKYEVTNAEFDAFIKATGYATIAEKVHNAMVFEPPLEEFEWMQDSTAYWRFPNGKSRGGIGNKMDHPVTCICFTDILAYCEWAGVRLPTLDEWEAASRAGAATRFFFGKTSSNIGRYANIWHGYDHRKTDKGDAWMYTSPVGSFAPNAWGLYDMYGNLFEYCSDRISSLKEKNELAMARGGSWWCSTDACSFFNSVDIGRNDKMASFSNQGFRVVLK
jgi:sulfatase modifying factor 1